MMFPNCTATLQGRAFSPAFSDIRGDMKMEPFYSISHYSACWCKYIAKVARSPLITESLFGGRRHLEFFK